MIHIQRDMICSKCDSINNHERITRVEGSITIMLIRCTQCGHEHEEGSITTWSSGNTGTYTVTPIDSFLKGDVY